METSSTTRLHNCPECTSTLVLCTRVRCLRGRRGGPLEGVPDDPLDAEVGVQRRPRWRSRAGCPCAAARRCRRRGPRCPPAARPGRSPCRRPAGRGTPGYSRAGRRLTWWSSSNRMPQQQAALEDARTAPSGRRRRRAGSRRARAARAAPSPGSSSPVRCQRAAPRSYSVVSTPGTTPRRTLRPSATTSGPMPSPGITAKLHRGQRLVATSRAPAPVHAGRPPRRACGGRPVVSGGAVRSADRLGTTGWTVAPPPTPRSAPAGSARSPCRCAAAPPGRPRPRRRRRPRRRTPGPG